MFTRKMKLMLDDLVVGTTPMLVPSFSSCADIDVWNTIRSTRKFIRNQILISAYDVQYQHGTIPSLRNLELIFLDSGGYECGKDDSRLFPSGVVSPREWTREIFERIAIRWPRFPRNPPTVIINFDHPNLRKPLDEQIMNAREFFRKQDGVLREFLIKPETRRSKKLNIDGILSGLPKMKRFDILGFAEKDLGNSVHDRMIAISKIRSSMDEQRIKKPIHIFGSLDPVTTPLYFISGADIFDGLSWLRFSFHNADAYYTESLGPKIEGIKLSREQIWARTIFKNLNYLIELRNRMERFQQTMDFSIFEDNATFLKKSYEQLMKQIGGIF